MKETRNITTHFRITQNLYDSVAAIRRDHHKACGKRVKRPPRWAF